MQPTPHCFCTNEQGITGTAFILGLAGDAATLCANGLEFEAITMEIVYYNCVVGPY